MSRMASEPWPSDRAQKPEPEKAPRKKRKAKTRPEPPKYVLQWKVGRKVQQSSLTFNHPADAELHAHMVGATKYDIVTISKEEADRRERLSESRAIGKHIQDIQASIERLRMRIRKAGGVYQLEFKCQHVEVYGVGKGKTQAMILFGGN